VPQFISLLSDASRSQLRVPNKSANVVRGSQIHHVRRLPRRLTSSTSPIRHCYPDAVDPVHCVAGHNQRVSRTGKLRGSDPRPVPLWGKRADRTCLNAIEAFAPFSAHVIIAQLTAKATAMTAFWATCLFWLRLHHPVVYLLGTPYIGTLAFRLGLAAVAVRSRCRLSWSAT